MKHRYPDEDEEKELEELEYRDDDDEDEHVIPPPRRTCIHQHEVIGLWERIEQHREAIAQELETFDDWLDGAPELAAVWREFTQLGGVTVSELQRFLDGRTFRHRVTRQRRHLRLISNRRDKR